ncbi:MAG: hypothetical protein MUE85_20040 [Microscillaceae bacterium]|jgi:hypothetical protein|nr:hypothetical protein [Microscillaceae bacterium]
MNTILSCFFKKRILGVFIGIFLGFDLVAQDSPSYWRTLADVSFKTKVEGKYKVEYPVFGKQVQAINGKVISLRGYVLPVEVSQPNQFIFSLYPYSSCYFCGGAGLETVVEVNAKTKIPYSSKPVTIRGKFRLNERSYDQMMYILDEAELE